MQQRLGTVASGMRSHASAQRPALQCLVDEPTYQLLMQWGAVFWCWSGMTSMMMGVVHGGARGLVFLEIKCAIETGVG